MVRREWQSEGSLEWLALKGSPKGGRAARPEAKNLRGIQGVRRAEHQADGSESGSAVISRVGAPDDVVGALAAPAFPADPGGSRAGV